VSPVPAQRAFVACAPGLEEALARELGALGLAARAVAGGAEAEGRDAWAVACVGSRAADAVKARLWEGPTSGLAAARRDLAARLPGVELEARRDGSRATISADAGGPSLFKRGWRARVGAAPLRESLAAGMLLELGYDGTGPFLDPMCGSGTIAIEAALLAARRAPGLGRTFPFESWPGHDAPRTRAVRERLAERARVPPAPVVASDRNGGAVRLAGKNAAAAGAAGWVRVERRDAAEVTPPPGRGTCLVNPPYGVRLDRDVEGSIRALAALLPRLRGWTVGVLAGDASTARLLPGRPARELDVRNGGIRCRFLVFVTEP
jgi:putative N6-adenine-specific DNA methylase